MSRHPVSTPLGSEFQLLRGVRRRPINRRAFLRAGAVAVGLPFLEGLPDRSAWAAGEAVHIDRQKWSFGGLFGKFDDAQLQRGFKVYTEVCARCHGIKRLQFRNLVQPGGPGFPEAAVKSLAANNYQVDDAPDDRRVAGPERCGEVRRVRAGERDRTGRQRHARERAAAHRCFRRDHIGVDAPARERGGHAAGACLELLGPGREQTGHRHCVNPHSPNMTLAMRK